MAKPFTYTNSFITFRGMKLITTPQAMRILAIEGKPINWRTFIKLVSRENMEPDFISPQGTKFWEEKRILKLKEKLPTKRMPGKGIL